MQSELRQWHVIPTAPMRHRPHTKGEGGRPPAAPYGIEGIEQVIGRVNLALVQDIEL